MTKSAVTVNDANHPIWPLARLIVMVIGLTVVLYFNASHFDETELRAIVATFLVAGGAEGLTSFLTRAKGG